VSEGINRWDGTDFQYFHEGEKGEHVSTNSRAYNYGNWETLRLLLSNLEYFLLEFRVDGFYFNGVSSMIYHERGSVGLFLFNAIKK